MSIRMILACCSLCLLATKTESPSADQLHKAFWGRFQEDADPAQAFAWYQELLAEPHENANSSGYRGIINLLARNEQAGAIAQLIPQVDHLFQHDVPLQLMFVKALYSTGNNDAADDKIAQLAQRIKDNPEVTLLAAQMYVRRKELESGILVLKEYLNATPEGMHNPILYLLLTQLQMMLQQDDAARTTITALLKLHPSYAQGWLIYGALQQKSGNLDKALRSFVRYLALTEGNLFPLVSVQVQQCIEQYKQQLADPNHKLMLNLDRLNTLNSLITKGSFKEADVFLDTSFASSSPLVHKLNGPQSVIKQQPTTSFLHRLYDGLRYAGMMLVNLFTQPLLSVSNWHYRSL